jgi:hypothetical protein
VRALDALIENFLVDTKAVRPQPNPAYDPAAKPAPAKAKKAAAKKVSSTGGDLRQQLEAASDAEL